MINERLPFSAFYWTDPRQSADKIGLMTAHQREAVQAFNAFYSDEH